MKKQLPNKIDVELIEAVKKAAKKDGRSVNNWLQKVLWKAVKE
jgi:hypothetical protein